MDSYFVVDERSKRGFVVLQNRTRAQRRGSRPERRSEASERSVRPRLRRWANAKESGFRDDDFRDDDRSSEEGRREDALASGADEGRDKLR